MNNSKQLLTTTSEVMTMLGYKSLSSFWQAVYRDGIPHVRLNARVIRFPQAELKTDAESRSPHNWAT